VSSDLTEPTLVPCPVCRTAAPWDNNPWRPFCSERCRLIDLGEWFDEEKRIPGEPALPPEDHPEQ